MAFLLFLGILVMSILLTLVTIAALAFVVALVDHTEIGALIVTIGLIVFWISVLYRWVG